MRYDRQVRLKEIGSNGQKEIKAAHIAVIGAGGLGSQLLPIFVGAGVGKITIIDFDDVHISNLHRQLLYRENQIGENKALCAAHNLKLLNSEVTIEPIAEKLTSHNADSLLKDCSLILDATDNFDTKLLINNIAGRMQKPLIYGSVRRFEGQVSYLKPHEGYGLHCFIKPPNEQQKQLEYTGGVLPSQVAFVAALQAQMAIGYIVGGMLKPKLGELIVIDGLELIVQKHMIPKISVDF